MNRTEKIVKDYGKEKGLFTFCLSLHCVEPFTHNMLIAVLGFDKLYFLDDGVYQLEQKLAKAERELQELISHMNVVSKKLAVHGILPSETYQNGQCNGQNQQVIIILVFISMNSDQSIAYVNR